MKEKLTLEELCGAFRSATNKARGKERGVDKPIRKPKPGAVREITCLICGKTFTVPSLGTGRMKYCPECAKGIKAKQNRESHKALKSARAEEAETARKKRKKREGMLDAMAKAARAAGMSYGRYVALKGIGRI